MNISFGGCRLSCERPLPVGTAITVTIRTSTDTFEATAKVAYSSQNDVGVMFDAVSSRSLLILKKWISDYAKVKLAIKSITSSKAGTPRHSM